MVQSIREEITRCKGFLPPGGQDESTYTPINCERELFLTVFARYHAKLQAKKLVDFEDMLHKTYSHFRTHPEDLSFWQQRYSYILIDEFQDINPIQYEIVKMLSLPRNNLFVVGDDDQSVYGFRGATPGIMLRFPKDYPDTKTVLLPVNYRCSAEVLSAASALISCNRERYRKNLTSAQGSNTPVSFPVYSDTNEEYASVTEQIRTLLREGNDPNDIAVLFRTNLEMRGLLPLLTKAGIPFCCRHLPPTLYGNAAVLPVLSYLRIAAGGRNRADWLTVINKPVRYAERAVFTTKEVNLKEVYTLLHQRGKNVVVDRLRKLEADFARLSRMNPYAAIHYIRHIIGYNRHLADTLSEPSEAMDLLDEVMAEAGQFRTIPEFLSYADSENDRRRKAREDAAKGKGVPILTFHRAKGLEFRHVFVLNCNELVTPHKKALLPEQIAEERRLFYVAMTRAKETLSLMYVKKHLSHERMPSRFLGEIRLPGEQLVPGTPVFHVRFGEGTILSLTPKEVRVRFNGLLLPKSLPLPVSRDDGSLILASYDYSMPSSSRSS